MAKFVPRDKMSKKAQKELNRLRRKTWSFSPVTQTVDSRKVYDRKRKAHDRHDEPYGMGFDYYPAAAQAPSMTVKAVP